MEQVDSQLAELRSKQARVRAKFDRALAKWNEISDSAKVSRRKFVEATSRGRIHSVLYRRFELSTLKSAKNYYYRYLKKQARLLGNLGKEAHNLRTVALGHASHLVTSESSSSGSSTYSIPGMYDDQPIDEIPTHDQLSTASSIIHWQCAYPYRLSE